MKNKEVIAVLVDELNEMKLPNMAATLEDLSRSRNFDPSDGIGLLREIIDSEYQFKLAAGTMTGSRKGIWQEAPRRS